MYNPLYTWLRSIALANDLGMLLVIVGVVMAFILLMIGLYASVSSRYPNLWQRRILYGFIHWGVVFTTLISGTF